MKNQPENTISGTYKMIERDSKKTLEIPFCLFADDTPKSENPHTARMLFGDQYFDGTYYPMLHTFQENKPVKGKRLVECMLTFIDNEVLALDISSKSEQLKSRIFRY